MHQDGSSISTTLRVGHNASIPLNRVDSPCLVPSPTKPYFEASHPFERNLMFHVKHVVHRGEARGVALIST